MRYGLVRVGFAAVVVLLGSDVAAGAARPSAETRALLRCEREVVREGVYYANHVNTVMARCLRALSDCDLGDGAACRLSQRVCGGVGENLAALEARSRTDVKNACSAVPMPRLLDAGFGGSMSDCPLAGHADFADCYVKQLRVETGRLLRRMQPDACTLLASGGVGVPAELCAPEDVCPEVPENPAPLDGTLYCGGADAVACPAGMVCDRSDALCTVEDVAGKCVPMPESCQSGEPVCGCDGTTYGSDCERLLAGATKERDGACDMAPVACGFGNPDCPEGYFCDYQGGDCGEGSPGVCMPMRAEPCDLCSEFVAGPVCGCDMVTYTNECDRRAAGASKFFNGPCQ